MPWLVLLAWLTSLQPPGQVIVCRSIGLDPARTWTFAPADGTWQVTHQAADAARAVSLVLPNAKAEVTGTTVFLRARTANGGIDVTLKGPRARATLDAYINYELEVNVDASLTPEIDEIDTDGPVGVACGD
jgi:hypothetical protein